MRIKKVERLTKCVSELVQATQTIFSESSEKLKSIGCRVNRNKKKIDELELSIKKIQDDDGSSTSRSIPRLQSSGDGLSIADVMANQARFSTALQLRNSPMMLFGGELHKYVQFVTMFRNTFNKNSNDSVALYDILMRHVKGPAKKAM